MCILASAFFIFLLSIAITNTLMLPTHSKVAIVTGASRGIGRQVALALGRAGCSVVVNFNSNEQAAKDVCNLIRSGSGFATPFKADCSDPSNVSAMMDFTKREVCVLLKSKIMS
jgi:NAD(P)-dependent dehydrogenase (short-subunit alcohol dehydrogenase family)